MNDLEKKQRRIMGLREVNVTLVKEIETMGGEVDLIMARIENLIEFLVQQEVLTEEQKWHEQESWERRLRPQLISYRDRLREIIQEAANKRKQPGLILPSRTKQN